MKKIRWRQRAQLQKKMGVYEEHMLEQTICDTLTTPFTRRKISFVGTDGKKVTESFPLKTPSAPSMSGNMRNINRLMDEQGI